MFNREKKEFFRFVLIGIFYKYRIKDYSNENKENFYI